MLRDLIERLMDRPVEVSLRRYRKQLAAIDRAVGELTDLGDQALGERSTELIERARRGASPDSLLVPAFALTREASRRTIGLVPYDVQLLTGLVLCHHRVAEMATGEGKTLAAVFAACLHALAGRGVHVLTFNDYLARRDAGWMGPIYRFLGLSVGHVAEGMDSGARRDAYAADVTYVSCREAGFDFLRDQLCLDRGGLVHRPLHCAIVDEADSLLIDEARVPLVIAGEAPAETVDLAMIAAAVGQLGQADYGTDEGARNAHLTDFGIDHLEMILGCEQPLHDERSLATLTAVNEALHAHLLLRRDVDYVVRDGRIELVDEFTGRVADRRRWPYGLQAAVEAKEGVAVQPQGIIHGQITLQHYLRLYPRRSGMTATARDAAEELREFYDLKVTLIPPHRPCVRIDEPDQVFSHPEAKQAAVVSEIRRASAAGQPVLVGTASVRESEALARELVEAGITHAVLNAKNDAQEAEIVARAGQLRAVTISTNMAGRGTDIKLGDGVAGVGGLYVIGTNRHESRRIDDQLRGRAGRQGDPGRSRFLISLQDDLVDRYGLARMIPPDRWPETSDSPIRDPVIDRMIGHAQRVIEGESFIIRRTLAKYAMLVEEQRQLLADRRRVALHDPASLRLLALRSPGRYDALVEQYGEPLVQDVEARITMAQINACWSDHLARVAEIREAIHLVSITGLNPLDEFHNRVAEVFRELGREIDDRIVETFETAKIDASGIDLAAAGIGAPSATWTYLVSDRPYGYWIDRFASGLKRLLVGEE